MKQNGVEVSKSVLSTDTYEPMNKYILRGVKSVSAPVTPSETQSSTTLETQQKPETPVTATE